MSENVFIAKIPIMCVVHLHSGIVYSKLCTATKLCIFKLGFNQVNVAGKIINESGLLLD